MFFKDKSINQNSKYSVDYLKEVWRTQNDFKKKYTKPIIIEFGEVIYEKINNILEAFNNGADRYIISYLYTYKYIIIEKERRKDIEKILNIIGKEIIRVKQINLLTKTIKIIEQSYL